MLTLNHLRETVVFDAKPTSQIHVPSSKLQVLHLLHALKFHHKALKLRIAWKHGFADSVFPTTVEETISFNPGCREGVDKENT